MSTWAAKTDNFSLGLGVNYTGSSSVDEFGVQANGILKVAKSCFAALIRALKEVRLPNSPKSPVTNDKAVLLGGPFITDSKAVSI